MVVQNRMPVNNLLNILNLNSSEVMVQKCVKCIKLGR